MESSLVEVERPAARVPDASSIASVVAVQPDGPDTAAVRRRVQQARVGIERNPVDRYRRKAGRDRNPLTRIRLAHDDSEIRGRVDAVAGRVIRDAGHRLVADVGTAIDP